MRQVVLDGVLEVARGVAEAAVVAPLVMGAPGYRTSLGKVMEVTKHYIMAECDGLCLSLANRTF